MRQLEHHLPVRALSQPLQRQRRAQEVATARPRWSSGARSVGSRRKLSSFSSGIIGRATSASSETRFAGPSS
jgi:hypothetical protein